MDESDYKHVLELVRAGRAVMFQFRSGHHPTETQLDRLDRLLLNFDHMRLCGHMLIEDCDCFKGDK